MRAPVLLLLGLLAASPCAAQSGTRLVQDLGFGEAHFRVSVVAVSPEVAPVVQIVGTLGTARVSIVAPGQELTAWAERAEALLARTDPAEAVNTDAGDGKLSLSRTNAMSGRYTLSVADRYGLDFVPQEVDEQQLRSFIAAVRVGAVLATPATAASAGQAPAGPYFGDVVSY